MPKSWFGAPLARCGRAKQDFLTFLYLVYRDNQFITMVQVSKQLFKVAYVVSGMLFRALRARGAREAKNFHRSIIFTSRRFQRAIARPIPTTWCQEPRNKTFIII